MHDGLDGAAEVQGLGAKQLWLAELHGTHQVRKRWQAQPILQWQALAWEPPWQALAWEPQWQALAWELQWQAQAPHQFPHFQLAEAQWQAQALGETQA